MNQVSHPQVLLCQTWDLTYFSSSCLLFGVLPLFNFQNIGYFIFLYVVDIAISSDLESTP